MEAASGIEQHAGEQVGRNGTNTIHHLLYDPKGRVVSVEAFMVVGTCLLCFVVALGSYRPRSSSWCIRTLVWAVYTLLFFIFTFTIGFMQSSPTKNDLYPVWAVSFFSVLGCTNSITAYELDDNKQWMRQLVQLVLYYAYISMMLQYMSDNFVRISIGLLLGVTYFKNLMRIFACILASHSWNSSKLVADYMKHDAASMSAYDPISLEGYDYLVFWAGAKIRSEPPNYQKQLVATEDVLTIEKIWHFDGRLMKSTEGAQLKDVCLSFALYHLLKRRYFGFSCAESGAKKTHDFVFRGLLAREEDYNRAFKVIEVELSFLYDFFFTKYAFMNYQEHTLFYFTIISVTLISLVILAVIRARGIYHSLRDMTTVEIRSADIYITVLILSTLALLEILQFVLYWLSNWGKVSLTCRYVTHYRWKWHKLIERVLAFLCTITLFPHWQNKIGQYSLLESFEGNLCMKRLNNFIRWSNIMYNRYLDNMGINVTAVVNDRKGGVPIIVDSEVKKAIAESLKSSNGQLSNAVFSLARNGLTKQLSWACRQETQTHTILIWHIATTYCEISLAPPDLEVSTGNQEQEEVLIHRDVAIKLSRYCASLVVFVPELLPDHQYDTKAIFDEVEKEARELLGGASTLQDKYRIIENLGELEDTIFMKGSKLGKQLESIVDCKMRWKVMADFWAEMILYIAPSDNVKGHIERLTRGGEFLTHLWALLTHAGIVERSKDTKFM